MSKLIITEPKCCASEFFSWPQCHIEWSAILCTEWFSEQDGWAIEPTNRTHFLKNLQFRKIMEKQHQKFRIFKKSLECLGNSTWIYWNFQWFCEFPSSVKLQKHIQNGQQYRQGCVPVPPVSVGVHTKSQKQHSHTRCLESLEHNVENPHSKRLA